MASAHQLYPLHIAKSSGWMWQCDGNLGKDCAVLKMEQCAENVTDGWHS